MHIPVLLEQVIQFLDPQPGENFIDCTLGEAGHSIAILELTKPNGRVLGIDADSGLLKKIESEIKEEELRSRLDFVQGNFKDLKKIVEEKRFKPINGILFDLGLSSWQIDESGKGFTFKKDEPLIMTLNGRQEVTAEEIINTWPEESLIEIFKRYGEEKYSRKIVGGIVAHRKLTPIKTTFQLKEIVKRTVPLSERGRGRLTRVLARIFQALRIVINDELENLTQALPQAAEMVNLKGRIVVVSFHSLEDRIVKNFFRKEEEEDKLKILTKKPIITDEVEISMNPRSRSAKLRAAMKI